MPEKPVELGLGLIGIGRTWGYVPSLVPEESDAISFLEHAIDAGVTYLDTAPSYGYSEQRLGKVIRGLTPEQRAGLTIATKFGEHWDFERGQPFVDHTLGALKRSLDTSLELLGRIEVLQLHKTSPDVLRSDDLARAWEYARSLGVSRIGASVSDPESAGLAMADPAYDMLQLPYHREATQFGGILDRAGASGRPVAVNRPFGMGKLLYGAGQPDPVEAFRFVLDRLGNGVVLTGTKSITHLDENRAAFRQALAQIRSA